MLLDLIDQGRVIATNVAIRAASSSALSWLWCLELISEADIYGWTSAISGCVLASRWEMAEELNSQLRRESLEPGLITSNAVLGARDETSSSPWEVCMQHIYDCDVPWFILVALATSIMFP